MGAYQMKLQKCNSVVMKRWFDLEKRALGRYVLAVLLQVLLSICSCLISFNICLIALLVFFF